MDNITGNDLKNMIAKAQYHKVGRINILKKYDRIFYHIFIYINYSRIFDQVLVLINC